MPEPDFKLKRGDSGSSIYAILEDGAGAPVNILGAAVRFKMGPISGGTLVVADDATNGQVADGSDGSLGYVNYDWAQPVTFTGLYRAEWEVTYNDGLVVTYPNDGYNLVLVTPDL